MPYESFVVDVGTSETVLFQMPAYEKTEAGEYVIQPRSGSASLSLYNTGTSTELVTVKQKTLFDSEAKVIGEVSVKSGTSKQYPTMFSLGPGDYIAAEASNSDVIVGTVSATASNVRQRTPDDKLIWSPFSMRRPIDHAVAWAVASQSHGAGVAGGYYAGLIDTLTGNIIAADDYQTGLRYALIVSDKSLEGGRGSSPASGLPSGDLEWDTQNRGGEAGCFTRWNGLEATNVIIAKSDASYEAHGFIADVRSQYPAVATPGGSEWYLPAMDELELLYRNFKPNNADNFTDDRSYAFPGNQVQGTNPSSDPNGIPYENSPRIPDVTYLDLFKEGNAQAVDQLRYWSTTDADEDRRAWYQNFTNSGYEGYQYAPKFKIYPDRSVRPVRHVVL